MDRVRRLCLILALASALAAAVGASARPGGPALRVTVAGEGVVTSSDGRISCGRRCSAAYKPGAVRTLTATPSPYFEFERWTGACVGLAPSCLVAVERATSVRAAFKRKIGTLLLTVTGPGAIEVEPGGTVVRGGGSYPIAQGRTITLTPRPDSGAGLKGWEEACAGASLDGCSFAAGEEARYVAAGFGQVAPGEGLRTLTVSLDGYASVRSTPAGIDCPGTCSASFPAGTLVALRSGASDPYHTEWGGACGGYVHTCLIVLDASMSVSAFVPPGEFWGTNEALVTVSGPGVVSDASGRITCGGRFGRCRATAVASGGFQLRLRAAPSRRARFGGWGGVCRGKKPRCTASGGRSVIVLAFFRRRP